MKRNGKRIVPIVAVLSLVAIQLVPVDRSNPPVEADLEVPSAVTAVLQSSYSYVAPVSWLVAHDIEEARGEFSFSHWGRLGERERAELPAEIREEVEEGEMPLTIERGMSS